MKSVILGDYGIMPGFFVSAGSSIICLHGGRVSPITMNRKVLVSGQAVATQNDAFPISLCTFNTGSPHPCVITKWLVPSLRIKVNGQPIILSDSVGICQSADQSPQCTPNVISTQVRVKGV